MALRGIDKENMTFKFPEMASLTVLKLIGVDEQCHKILETIGMDEKYHTSNEKKEANRVTFQKLINSSRKLEVLTVGNIGKTFFKSLSVERLPRLKALKMKNAAIPELTIDLPYCLAVVVPAIRSHRKRILLYITPL